MTSPVTRRYPRVTLDRVAYIKIEPGNGGIILNVSNGGLCFHSVAPVARNGPVLFFLQEHNRSLAGCAELAWVDAESKSGGLRFTALSAEARDQINEWTTNAPTPLQNDAPIGASTQQISGDSASVDTSAIAAAVKIPIKGSRFSTGFLTGFLVSVLWASMVLFAYAHHSELGEYLVRLGQSLSGDSGSQTTKVSNSRQAVIPAAASPAQVVSAATAFPNKESGSATPLKAAVVPPAQGSQIPAEHQSNLRSSAAAEAHPSAAVEKTERPQGKSVKLISDNSAALPIATQHSALRQIAPPPVFLNAPASPFPAFNFNEAQPLPVLASDVKVPRIETAPVVGATDSIVQMYFDLGKFKDELTARGMSNRVAELGLRTTVLKKRIFWKASYQVLVGPYDDQEEETSIRTKLLLHGYKARPYERGSRNFLFLSRVSLNGSRLPVESPFTIRWESYVEEADVQFIQDGDVIASVHGKWIKRPQKYSRNEYVYVNSGNGSKKALIEIHFSGLNRALVFGNSS